MDAAPMDATTPTTTQTTDTLGATPMTDIPDDDLPYLSVGDHVTIDGTEYIIRKIDLETMELEPVKETDDNQA